MVQIASRRSLPHYSGIAADGFGCLLILLVLDAVLGLGDSVGAALAL